MLKRYTRAAAVALVALAAGLTIADDRPDLVVAVNTVPGSLEGIY